MTTVSWLDDRPRAFLASARTAVLATTGPSGRPRLVPICFVLRVGEPGARMLLLYSPLDDKPKAGSDPHDLARLRDLVARPEATLLVDRWSEDWDRLGWLRLDVHGAVLEPGGTDGAEHTEAIRALRAKYTQYLTHRLEERPILRFTVERVVTWGDLGTTEG